MEGDEVVAEGFGIQNDVFVVGGKDDTEAMEGSKVRRGCQSGRDALGRYGDIGNVIEVIDFRDAGVFDAEDFIIFLWGHGRARAHCVDGFSVVAGGKPKMGEVGEPAKACVRVYDAAGIGLLDGLFTDPVNLESATKVRAG